MEAAPRIVGHDHQPTHCAGVIATVQPRGAELALCLTIVSNSVPMECAVPPRYGLRPRSKLIPALSRQ
jgi:hypothetical protein